MQIFLKILENIFLSAFFAVGLTFCIWLLICAIFRKKQVDEDFVKRTFTYIALTIISLLFIRAMYKDYLGPKAIGAFLERSSYHEYYYVNLFPDQITVKNYRVKALIEVNNDSFSIGRSISLERVCWPNGGYTFFDSSIFTSIEPNKKVLVVDDEEKEWVAELTLKKAK